jgi:hypothetical protein
MSPFEKISAVLFGAIIIGVTIWFDWHILAFLIAILAGKMISDYIEKVISPKMSKYWFFRRRQ